jgi:predicted alpha/beta hydrolase family esterase
MSLIVENDRALAPVLILPGWQGSGPEHWQSRWEVLYGDQRVEQHDWMRPLRGDWISRLEDVVLAQPGPVLLAAHSLGCVLVAAWAAHSQNTHRVRAALLVAPGDVEQVDELRSCLHSWSPLPQQALPFPTLLLGSQNDPYCRLDRAQTFARQWGSEFIDYGARGHINAQSGLGDWPEGRALLARLNRTEFNEGN